MKQEDIRKITAQVRQFFSDEHSETRVKVILLVGFAAIALIFFSDRLADRAETVSAAAGASVGTNASDMDYDAYTRQLEARLTELIASSEGAGETKVMITLECGTEYVYASQQKTTSAKSDNTDSGGRTSSDEKRTGEDSIILIKSGKGEEPLIRKEITPTVAGVVVVCQGADDAAVRQRVTDIVTTALGTSSNRVCVTRLG